MEDAIISLIRVKVSSSEGVKKSSSTVVEVEEEVAVEEEESAAEGVVDFVPKILS